MDYFDDLEILAVSKCITNRNGSPGKQCCGAIGIMLQGPAIFCENGMEVKLETPFLYWSLKNDESCWKTPQGVMRVNIWISANGLRFERMLASLCHLNPNSKYIFLENPKKLIEIFARMRNCWERKTNSDKYRLPLLVEELMAVIGEILAPEEISGRMCNEVRKIAEEMSDFPERDFNIEAIAKEAEVSIDYFRHCFQQYIGTSFHDYLLTQRYALAVRLLRETNRNIGDISETCGFSEQRLFTHFFKKRSGISPREFRKNTY